MPPRQVQCSWPVVACQPSWGDSELQDQRQTLSQETRVDSNRRHSNPPVSSAWAYTQTCQLSSFLTKERSKSAYNCLQQKGRHLSSITPSPIVSINYMWSEKTKQWPAHPTSMFSKLGNSLPPNILSIFRSIFLAHLPQFRITSFLSKYHPFVRVENEGHTDWENGGLKKVPASVPALGPRFLYL